MNQEEHFDEVTKALAAPVSRGRMLKLVGGALLGGALGGWGLTLGADEAEAKKKKKKKKKKPQPSSPCTGVSVFGCGPLCKSCLNPRFPEHGTIVRSSCDSGTCIVFYEDGFRDQW